MDVIVQNKKAYFNYFIIEKYEAGIVLLGSEIKSIRLHKVNIDQAYVTMKQNQATILNMNISKYEHSTMFVPDPDRTRVLLLNKKEIRKIAQRVKLERLTVVPLKLYFQRNRVKLEIGLARGKKNYDKREVIKARDEARDLQKFIKR